MNSQETSSTIERLGFSYDEAANALGLSLSTVKRLIGSGQLRSVAIGRRKIIPRVEIERLLQDGVNRAA